MNSLATSPAESPLPPADAARQWYIVSRWAEYEGEARANLLRILAVGVFYGIELITYYGLHLGWLQVEAASDRRFHLAVTALAAAWALMAMLVLFCLKRRMFPAGLMYLSTGADIMLLTMILLAGSGPRSPMVIGFFLVITLSALRLNLRLIWFASGGALIGYLVCLGFARWCAPPDIDMTVPRYQQLIVLAALALQGVMLGQLVRRLPRLAEDFARRTARLTGGQDG